MKVAFLGLGRMGSAMARHVVDAGHDLVVWNRTAGKATGLIAAGAREAPSPADAARDAEAVVLMLFGPDSVRAVLPEVLEGAPEGALVLDSTTIGPDAAREFGALCGFRGARYLDVPVAGSTAPAKEGTLGVFAGGSVADFADAEPLLHLWGDPAKVRRVGEVGAGSALKLCVNQGIGVLAAGLGETLRLGSDLELDRTMLLDVLSATAYGWVLNQKRPMIEAGDYSATAFSLDLMAKDLDLAVRAAAGVAETGLPVTRAALEQARSALHAGHSDEDYAAVIGHIAGSA
ncbi:MAG TPA: NAD(P)-dependent oxidoreductase [Mycobacteriales bacterium]|nr:NAD(P)-dependent oxidoreductase [Mycobacteriales bacterium]